MTLSWRTLCPAKKVVDAPRLWIRYLVVLGLTITVQLCGSAYSADNRQGETIAQAQVAGRPGPDDSELKDLIDAARKEKDLLFYTSSVENVAKLVAAGFKAKYGINVDFLRLPLGPLATRFANEAAANIIAADLVILSGTSSRIFAQDGVKKGWLQSMSAADLPIVKSGHFPAKFLTDNTAILQSQPWGSIYDAERLRGADIPRNWLDLLNPKLNGQILVVDPKNSEAYADIYSLLLDEYGEDFFLKLQAQNLRRFPNAAQAVQSLAAGEGLITFPQIISFAQTLKSKGANVDFVAPGLTTGLEFHLMLTSPGKAKHPNAARLFANYLMSPDGNAVFNEGANGIAPYETKNLPDEYRSPKLDSFSRIGHIAKLLGF